MRIPRRLRRIQAPMPSNSEVSGGVQLHVHVVGRFHHDPLWPDPIWGRGEPQSYRPAELAAMAERYRAAAAELSAR